MKLKEDHINYYINNFWTHADEWSKREVKHLLECLADADKRNDFIKWIDSDMTETD